MAKKPKSFFDRRDTAPQTKKVANVTTTAKKKPTGTYYQVMAPKKKKAPVQRQATTTTARKKKYTPVPTPTLKVKPKSEMSPKGRRVYDEMMRDQAAALKKHAKVFPNTPTARKWRESQAKKKK